MTVARRVRGILAAGVAWAALLCAPPARAQPENPPAADVLFRAGRQAMAAGRIAEACEKFRESNRLEPAAGTVLNLALCEEKLGHLAAAWGLFKRALSELPPSDDRVNMAREGVERIDRRLARLTIHLSPDTPAGTQVLMDGAPLTQASFGTPLPADPGTTVIVIKAPGHAQREITVTLTAGGKLEVTLPVGEPLVAGSEGQPGSEPSAAATAAGSPSDPVRDLPARESEAAVGSRAAMGWVAAGLGTASLAVGAVTGAMVLGKKATVDEHCTPEGYCDQTGLDAASDGRTLSTVSTVTFLAGLAGVGVGLYLVLSSHDGADRVAVVAPALVRSGAGLGVAARF